MRQHVGISRVAQHLRGAGMYALQQDNFDFALGERSGSHEIRFSRELVLEVTRLESKAALARREFEVPGP